MMANHVAPVLAIQLLFLAYLLSPTNKLANRTTIHLATECLFFAGMLAQSLTLLAQFIVGPPVTSTCRILRATIGIVCPLNLNLAFVLGFLEKLLEEARDAEDATMRAIRYANTTSVIVLYALFGLVLANSIAGLANEQPRRMIFSVRELLDVIVFSTIAAWSVVALQGIFAAVRPNIPGATLSESEVLEVMDWTLFHRETVVWIHHARNTFLAGIEHEQALRVPVDLMFMIRVSPFSCPRSPGAHSLAASNCVQLHTCDAGNAF